MGLQQRLLHQVRGIELALKLVCKLKPGQKQQVASIRFHRTHGNDPFVFHAELTYGLLTDERAKLSASNSNFREVARVLLKRRVPISHTRQGGHENTSSQE